MSGFIDKIGNMARALIKNHPEYAQPRDPNVRISPAEMMQRAAIGHWQAKGLIPPQGAAPQAPMTPTGHFDPTLGRVAPMQAPGMPMGGRKGGAGVRPPVPAGNKLNPNNPLNPYS